MPDRRLAGALAALAVLLAATASPAPAAEDVTAGELRELARRAEHDPAARRELAEVRRVDGRPVDMHTALAGADEGEQRARLRTLSEGVVPAEGTGAAPSPSPSPSQAEAQEDARRILDGRRYNAPEPPRPLRGVLRKLGEWLRAVVRPITDRWPDIGGVPVPVQGLLAAAVLAAAIVVAARLVRRRTAQAVGEAEGRRRRGDRGASLDPDVLEREADHAEGRGDLDAALRLRFRAGLLRLDAAGAIELRPSLTTGEVRRTVRSNALHELTAAFEAVAYAGEPAGPDDVAAARREWPRVLAEVARQ